MRGIKSGFARYGLAFVATAVALGVRLMLEPFWKDRLVFLTFYAAIIISVWYGGLGPGLLSIAMTVCICIALWVRFTAADAGDVVGLIGFAIVSLLTVFLAAALHRARARIESTAVALRANALALKDSERHFRAITEVISDYAYICSVEEDGRMVTEWMSQAFSRGTGYNLGDLNSRAWETRVFAEDRALVAEHQRRWMSGEPDMCEYRILDKRGNVIWLRNNVRPIWDPAKERVVRLYGAAKDITEKRAALNELKTRV